MNAHIFLIFGLLLQFSIFTYAAADKQPHIVIIGAGISGLAAADRLINKHKFQNVTILEALDRVGGRINPVPFDDAYIQLGAEWIHNRYNPLFEMALILGLIPRADVEPDDFETDFRYIDQNGCDVPQRLKNLFSKYIDNELNKMTAEGSFDGLNSTSFGTVMDDLYEQFLIDRGRLLNKTDTKILDAIMKSTRSDWEQFYSSTNWYQVSIREFKEAKRNTESGDNEEDDDEEAEAGPAGISIHLNKFGYKSILNEMTRRVNPTKHIQFNNRVQEIRWNSTDPENGIEIELSDGRIVRADHVIVTCSLGHLKHYGQSMFQPSLPKKKMDTIAALGFDTVDKLLLIFDKPFWPNGTSAVDLIRVEDEDGELPVCSTTKPLIETNLTRMLEIILISKVYPNVMLFWISGKDAPEFERASDTEVIDAVNSILRKYFNDPSLPVPRIMRSSWYSNPLFYGSYSYDSVNCDKLNCRRKNLIEPLSVMRKNRKVPVVLFAGEATHPSEYATTHGAFETGVREADRLGKMFKFH